MRASAVLHNLVARSRQRATWVATFLYGSAFAGLSLYFIGWRRASAWDLAYPFLLSLLYGLPSPFGWMWTGDDRHQAPFPRGLLQSLAWGALLVAALEGVMLVQAHGPGLRAWASWNLVFHVPMLATVGWFIAHGERVAESRREALAQAREARWSLLVSQLSPHFLFNALTAFAELGRRDWPATERGLLTLADVYRTLLALSERSASTLGEERRLLEAYLAIESLRLGERLRVAWDWPADLDGEAVPPLLLLPLVENAVKHGLERSPGGGDLRVSGRREGPGLRLEVANTGAWGLPPTRSTGTGLANLRARLHLGWQGRAACDLVREGAWTRATLVLPGPFRA